MLHVETATEFLDEPKKKIPVGHLNGVVQRIAYGENDGSNKDFRHHFQAETCEKSLMAASFSNGNKHLNEPILKTLVVALARPTLKV